MASYAALLSLRSHISRVLAGGLEQVLTWADQLVLAQKQDAETMRRIQASGIPLLALVNGSLEESSLEKTAHSQ